MPNRCSVSAGNQPVMPTINDNNEKPTPASDHDQDNSSIMKGKATPSEVNVDAVIWKKMTLTSANFHQPKKPVLGVPDSVTPAQIQSLRVPDRCIPRSLR